MNNGQEAFRRLVIQLRSGGGGRGGGPGRGAFAGGGLVALLAWTGLRIPRFALTGDLRLLGCFAGATFSGEVVGDGGNAALAESRRSIIVNLARRLRSTVEFRVWR